MRRLSTALTVLLVIVAIGVFGVAGYVLTSNDHVRHAGRALRMPDTSTAVATPSSSPDTSSPDTSSPDTSSPDTSSSDTSSTQPGGRLSVAFLGDDWTAGDGVTSHAERFSTLVARSLGLAQSNFGIDGTGYATSSDAGGDYLARVDRVVAADPDVVVVSGGRNDTHTDIATVQDAVSRLFTELHRRLPDATIVAVAPMWGDSDKPSSLSPIAAAVRAAVQSVGGHYLAVPDPIHGHPDYMADAADPDAAGYAVIANVLTPAIRALLPS